MRSAHRTFLCLLTLVAAFSMCSASAVEGDRALVSARVIARWGTWCPKTDQPWTCTESIFFSLIQSVRLNQERLGTFFSSANGTREIRRGGCPIDT